MSDPFEYDPRDNEPDNEPDNPPCPHCKGRGYIPHRGEPYACDPCGCIEWTEEDDE